MKNKLVLPLDGTVEATVDWGDGTTDNVTAVRPEHTYAKAGEYYVTVTGKVTKLGNRLSIPVANQSAIVRVIQWGQLGLESLKFLLNAILQFGVVTLVVVFPTPPFWLTIAMIFATEAPTFFTVSILL